MLEGLWFVAPVLGAYVVHAPVLRFDLWRALAIPLDGGATLRGRRWFGDNKTWRGALVMFAGVVAMKHHAGLGTTLAGAARNTPARVRRAARDRFRRGELPNSLIKRQLGIEPGARRRSTLGVALSIFDQADFVPGVWIALAPLWRMSLPQLAIVFAVAVIVHAAINVVGYAIGARRTWL